MEVEINKNKIIFELLEDIKISQKLVKRLEYLKNAGFKFSINNFDYLKHLEIIDYLDFVKLNIMDNDKIFKNISILKQYNTKPIAFKIESEVFYKIAQKLEFDLFQGYYFHYPQEELMELKSPEEKLIVKILNAVIKYEKIDIIEDYFKLSPNLLTNLILYINSAYFGFKTKITSIKRIISLLGYKNLEKWLLLQLFFSKKEFYILFEKATFRGKILEYITQDLFPELFEKAFLTGMLSILQEDDILYQIDLDEDIISAIKEKKGVLGELLFLLESSENNDFKSLDLILQKYKLDFKKLMEYELKSISWFENLKTKMKNVE
jgi:EAL and modified HD-GYP domain-containing signal transduction protein